MDSNPSGFHQPCPKGSLKTTLTFTLLKQPMQQWVGQMKTKRDRYFLEERFFQIEPKVVVINRNSVRFITQGRRS